MSVKGYKYSVYPTAEQKILLDRTFGSCRFIWNRLLEQSQNDYEAYKLDNKLPKPGVSGYNISCLLPELKAREEFHWLNEISSCALQQKALDLGKAFTNFFRKSNKGYPKFKSRRDRQSFRLMPRYFKIIGDTFYIAKCKKPVKLILHRDLPSEPSSCTISKNTVGEYYVSFTCEYTPVKTAGTGIVGIDAGITDLATLSNGITIANIRHYLQLEAKLAMLQRRLSKKMKGSKNRDKARLKVAKLHQRIANQRNDYLHKLTTQLVRDNQTIAIESLMIGNMVKNHKLAKHILDAAWGRMREQLKYKCIDSQHCVLILADPYYPSTQLCSACGVKPKDKIKLGALKWTCPSCGTTHQRDVNAAKNLEILAKSELHKRSLLGETSQIVLAPRYTQYI